MSCHRAKWLWLPTCLRAIDLSTTLPLLSNEIIDTHALIIIAFIKSEKRLDHCYQRKEKMQQRRRRQHNIGDDATTKITEKKRVRLRFIAFISCCKWNGRDFLLSELPRHCFWQNNYVHYPDYHCLFFFLKKKRILFLKRKEWRS